MEPDIPSAEELRAQAIARMNDQISETTERVTQRAANRFVSPEYYMRGNNTVNTFAVDITLPSDFYNPFNNPFNALLSPDPSVKKTQKEVDKSCLEEFIKTGQSNLIYEDNAGDVVMSRNGGQVLFVMSDKKVVASKESKHLKGLLEELANIQGLKFEMVDIIPSGRLKRLLYVKLKTHGKVDDTKLLSQVQAVEWNQPQEAIGGATPCPCDDANCPALIPEVSEDMPF